MSNVIKIPTEQSEYKGEEDHFISGWMDEIQLKGTYHRFKVGGWNKNGTGRKEYGYKKEHGPHAYAFGLESCITSHKVERAVPIEVSDGDTVEIDGEQYTVRVVRGEYIEFDNMET